MPLAGRAGVASESAFAPTSNFGAEYELDMSWSQANGSTLNDASIGGECSHRVHLLVHYQYVYCYAILRDVKYVRDSADVVRRSIASEPVCSWKYR